MSSRILLVNPPIHDFAAYDFWLKPYGLLKVGGMIRAGADIRLFDYLDRISSDHPAVRVDEYGRGPFHGERIQKPAAFSNTLRYYYRFGIRRKVFQEFLAQQGPFDFVLVQTVMTYWYPSVSEVIEDVRKYCPGAKIVLGGFYASICNEHAKTLGADTVIFGSELDELWQLMSLAPPMAEKSTPYWEGYKKLDTAVMKLTHGCPFSCSYCAAGKTAKKFIHRQLQDCVADFDCLCQLGVKDIAFYDDALLYKSKDVLEPFLEYVIESKTSVNFHTPNALHARFITSELADLMVRAGFKTFYLGFESNSADWQKKTGGKVCCDELKTAVENLRTAGVPAKNIIAYEILGHPDMDSQRLQESMRFVNDLGIRIALSDFSPIPGTPDGDKCAQWVDMSEPLNHNKIAFPIVLLGDKGVNRLKDLCRTLNDCIKNS